MAKLTEKVYGEALFELAVEEGRDQELLKEVTAVRALLDENPEFARLMNNPAIPESEKETVLQTVWEGHISREITGLMLLLLKKEHYGEITQVLDYFTARIRERQKIGVAYVETAMPITEEQKKRVEQRLLETTGYRSFEMHYRTEPLLIGGMVIRIGDRVVDNSIRTRLDNLSRQLYQIRLQ